MKHPKSTLDFNFIHPKASALCGLLWCAIGAIDCSGSSGGGTSNVMGGAAALGGATANAGGSITTGGTSLAGGATTSGGATMGGTLATGGVNSTIGTSNTGGAKTTGGSATTGGAPATGGVTASGGLKATGGALSTGGSLNTGGSKNAGGMTSTGGTKSTGGSSPMGSTTSNAGTGGALGLGGTTSSGGSSAANPCLQVCPNCKSIFDGTSLSGWTQVPAASWSVVSGAMHSLGTARGFIYTTNTYGSFRFIFTSRLISDPANHFPCVLFWGNSPAKDALSAIQIQPPNGYMWDYRTTGPTANQSPDRYETRFSHPAMVDTQWIQCEMLTNQATGTMRFACCQLTGTAPCKASEVVDFTDPTAGLTAPLALQVHNAAMIEEFKDLCVESPVADASVLLTTK